MKYGLAIGGYLASNAIASRRLGPDRFGYFVFVITYAGIFLLARRRLDLRTALR